MFGFQGIAIIGRRSFDCVRCPWHYSAYMQYLRFEVLEEDILCLHVCAN